MNKDSQEQTNYQSINLCTISNLHQELAKLIQRLENRLNPRLQQQLTESYQCLQKSLCDNNPESHFSALLQFKKNIHSLTKINNETFTNILSSLHQNINDFLIHHMQTNNDLLKLPDEILLKIFLLLKRRDISSVTFVCLRLHRICQDSKIINRTANSQRDYLAKPKCIFLSGHSDLITHQCLLPNGLFATGSMDNTLRIWDLKYAKCLQIIKLPELELIGVDALPSGKIMTHHLHNNCSRLYVWDPISAQQLQVIKFGSKTCYTIVSANTIVTASYGSNRFANNNQIKATNLRWWDIRSGQCIQKINTTYHVIMKLDTLPNGNLIGIAHKVQRLNNNRYNFIPYLTEICIWSEITGNRLRCHQLTQQFLTYMQNLNSCDVDYLSTIIVGPTPSTDGRIFLKIFRNAIIWDPKKNIITHFPDSLIVDNTTYLKTITNEKFVMSERRYLKIYSIKKEYPLQVLVDHKTLITALNLLPNGLIVSADKDKLIKIWDSVTGKCLQTLHIPDDFCNAIIPLHNGHFITCLKSSSALLWCFPKLTSNIAILDELKLSIYKYKLHRDQFVQCYLINGLLQQIHSDKIDLHTRNLNTQCMRVFCRGLHYNTTIVQLNLSHCRINNKGIRYLAKALTANSTVTLVNLQNNRFGSKGITKLATMLTINTTLKILDLRSNHFKEDDYKTVAIALMKNPNLIEFSLNKSRTTNGKYLQRIINFRQQMMTNQNDLSTLIKQMIHQGSLAKVKDIIEVLDSGIHYRDNDGNTLIHHAVMANRTSIVKYLVAQGADITEKNNAGISPYSLSMTLENPNKSIVKFLTATYGDTAPPNWLKNEIQFIQAKSLSVIDLNHGYFSKNYVTDPHVVFITKLLKDNQHIWRLNLCDNKIGERGAQEIVSLLDHNATLLEVKLNNNRCIRQSTLATIQAALQRNKWLLEQLHQQAYITLNVLRIFKHLQPTKHNPHLKVVVAKDNLLLYICQFLDEYKLLTRKQFIYILEYTNDKNTLPDNKNDFLLMTKTRQLALHRQRNLTFFGQQEQPLSRWKHHMFL